MDSEYYFRFNDLLVRCLDYQFYHFKTKSENYVIADSSVYVYLRNLVRHMILQAYRLVSEFTPRFSKKSEFEKIDMLMLFSIKN